MNYKILNINHNCYLNVILQILLNNDKTYSIIKEYLVEKNNIIDPESVLKLLQDKIDISKQNDCQETLLALIDKIPKLNEYFEGESHSKFKCNLCNHRRTVIDKFISISIYKEKLKDSINEIIKNEEMFLDCDNCKARTKTTKTCNIKKLGNLVLFLNTVKLKVNIEDYFIYNNLKYELTGIIKHFGGSNFGHYIYIDCINLIEYSDTTINKINKYTNDDIYIILYK